MQNLLITGANHDERVKYATSVAQKLLCDYQSTNEGCGQCTNCKRVLFRTHPNLTFIEPQASSSATSKAPLKGDAQLNNEIKIAQVRNIIQESHKTNYEKGPAIFIVSHMHQTTKAAANALLKVIEESSSDKIFLALAPSRTSVLPTIASRLISHIVRPNSLVIENIDRLMCNKIWAITTTEPKFRFDFCSQFSINRTELLDELAEVEQCCHLLLRAYFKQHHEFYPEALHPRLALKLSDGLSIALGHLLRNLNTRVVIENLIFRQWPYSCR